MIDPGSTKSGFVTFVIAAAYVAGTAVATALIWWLGDWQGYPWALHLTLRILWGCCLVAVAATLLTRLTIIGWYFRRYFRPAEQAVPPPEPIGTGPRRPTRAPWYKSGALSFSMTVSLVSLAGVTAVASAVIWVMGDVFGNDLMWLILKCIWGAAWIAAIAIVLTRVGVFRLHMLKGKAAESRAEPPEQSSDRLSLE